MTQHLPTGVEQTGLPLPSQQQQQQQQLQHQSALIPDALAQAAATDEALGGPGVTEAVREDDASVDLFSPTVLKGIAASALEQPAQSPTIQPSTFDLENPTFPQQPPAQPPAPPSSHNHHHPYHHPNLKLATNFSPSPVLTGKPITPTSYHAESATGNATPTLHQQGNMGSQISKLVGHSLAQKPLPSQLQQQQTQQQQQHPNSGIQLTRQIAGTAGKRPSMRQVATAQDDMTSAERAARTQKIRDIINEQFGLEILLKHRELQDIEAELGRAEACLEQIRRCSIEEAMEKDGRFDDPSGITMAYAPAPEVLNGPYSRDYRDWLMEERVSSGRSRYHDVLAKDQSRNFVIQRRGEPAQSLHQPAGRPQREVAAATAAAQSQKRATICLHRQPDGTIVRLTCIDCKRDQFGSMQGFINHCRLAHQRDFQTHDHAAAVCGSPFDLAGYTGPLPAPRSNKASKYVSSSVPPAGSKPTKSGSNTKKATKASSSSSSKKKNGAAVAIADENAMMMTTGPLTPPLQAEDITLRKTIQTSHLKEYLGKKRIDVDNLDMMVEEAVNRVGIVEDESDADDEDGEEAVTPAVVSAGTNKKKQKAAATTTTTTTKVAPHPEVQPAPQAGIPQAEQTPPTLRHPPTAADVAMMDLTIDTSVGGMGVAISAGNKMTPGGAADSTYEGSEAIVDLTDPGNTMQVTTPKGDDGEQARSVSLRSNPGSSRQSPRSPVAPTLPTRMGTRAHPSPGKDNSATRYSTRLA